MLTAAEIAEHNHRQSCWIVIEGQAYDVTDFLDSHPGGAAIILRYGGKVCISIDSASDCIKTFLGRNGGICTSPSAWNNREGTSPR